MANQHIVISGINGFVGKHLAKELYDNGHSVVGIGRDKEVDPTIADYVTEYHQTDLTKTWPNIPNPAAVIHLAGLAAIGASFDRPQEYIETNSSMVTNLCEYYLKQENKPRIVIVSSGALYDPNQPMPINENGKVNYSSSPYTISKAINEHQVGYYHSKGLDCILVRPFNHIGPGQNKGFILPDLYNQLNSLGINEHTIKAGNLETRRDYTDVRDIVRAYSKLALTSVLTHRIYNLCSGKSLSGIEIFNELKAIMELTDADYEVNQSLARPNDAKNIVGDASRLKQELNWSPQISLRQTIRDFVKEKSRAQ